MNVHITPQLEALSMDFLDAIELDNIGRAKSRLIMIEIELCKVSEEVADRSIDINRLGMSNAAEAMYIAACRLEDDALGSEFFQCHQLILEMAEERVAESRARQEELRRQWQTALRAAQELLERKAAELEERVRFGAAIDALMSPKPTPMPLLYGFAYSLDEGSLRLATTW